MQIIKSDLLWAQLMKQFNTVKNEIIEISKSEYDDISEHLSPSEEETPVNTIVPKLLKYINYRNIVTFKNINSIVLKSCIFLVYDDNSYEDVTTKCSFKIKSGDGILERQNIYEDNSVRLDVSTNTFENNNIIIEAEYKDLKCNIITYQMANRDFWYVGIDMPNENSINIVNNGSAECGWREIELPLSEYDENTPIYDGSIPIEIAPALNSIDYYVMIPESCYLKDAINRIDSGIFIKNIVIQNKYYNVYKRNGLEFSFPIYREII